MAQRLTIPTGEISPQSVPPSPNDSAPNYVANLSKSLSNNSLSDSLSDSLSATFSLATQPHPEPGQLHLTPCTVDDFVELPNRVDDRYELVDGLLYHISDMPDTEHGRIVHYIIAILRASRILRSENLAVHTVAGIAIRKPGKRHGTRASPRQEVSASTSISPPHSLAETATVRLADVAIGPALTVEQMGNVSPRSKKLNFPVSKPPAVAIEVTSHNRRHDLEVKKDEYEETGVKVYIIVDRQQQRVIVHTLSRGSYRESSFTNNDLVDCYLFRDIGKSAKDILHPPQTAEEATYSPIRRAEARAKEERREKEKERREKEEERREKEEERREKEKALAKVARLEAELEKLSKQGGQGNSSEAGASRGATSSPPRKRNKNKKNKNT